MPRKKKSIPVEGAPGVVEAPAPKVKPVYLPEIPSIEEAKAEITVADDPNETACPVDIREERDYAVSKKDAAGIAERMVDLLVKSVPVEEAVAIAGGSPQMLKNPTLVAALERLNSMGMVGAELQRAALRQGDFQAWATLWQKGMEAMDKDEQGGALALLKEAAGYSKMIRSDPAVGLTAPPVTQVNIDMTPLKGVLDKLPEPAEAFEWGEEEEK